MDDFRLYHFRFCPTGFCGEEKPTQHAFVWGHEQATDETIREAAHQQVSVGSAADVEVQRSEVEPAVVEAESVSA